MVSGGLVLIIYAYHETLESRGNVEYFLRHLMPKERGDHVFVVNGKHSVIFPDHVEVVERENRCYDFGAWGIGLSKKRNYTHYIFLNGSVRGPFLPLFERRQWWDVLLDELGGPSNVGLVGTSLNCWSSLEETHLQSMVLATHRRGLDLLLKHDLLACRGSHSEAVFESEIPTSQTFLKANFSLKTMLTAFASTLPPRGVITPDVLRDGSPARSRLLELCLDARVQNHHGGDPYYPSEYGGIDLSPLETIFFKTNRNVAPGHLDTYTRWLRPDPSSLDVIVSPLDNECRSSDLLPEPPYLAVIFSSSQRIGDSAGDDYDAVAQRMVDLAVMQPGYLGHESSRGSDGFGITVSYWRDERSVTSWRDHLEHTGARDRGRADFYSRYILRVATVDRQYSWESTS